MRCSWRPFFQLWSSSRRSRSSEDEDDDEEEEEDDDDGTVVRTSSLVASYTMRHPSHRDSTTPRRVRRVELRLLGGVGVLVTLRTWTAATASTLALLDKVVRVAVRHLEGRRIVNLD
ncbi:hypothetical protein U9M48_044203 [Paspalum notatum var. saurae]|uniref:Uncharacterized protein n=1 Tax=Paspalum notatum var. saurae TaxID=547442 RepID=A0AAQ3UZ53_PASNO